MVYVHLKMKGDATLLYLFICASKPTSQPAENTRVAQHAREETKIYIYRTLWMNQDLYKLSKGCSKY